MSRTLLLCFIHGFKGNDDSFGHFPEDLKRTVSSELPDHRVESVVYPKYATKGELVEASGNFLECGFVASDALFQLLNERATADNPDTPLFPLIQGILSFDTPLNGLARSLFVYGAFSNYQKVSSVWNVMTALSAAPAGLGMALKRGARSLPGPVSRSTGAGAVAGPAAWKTWQMVAVRTGTVGAIAAGGVAAYVHREQLKEAAQKARTLRRQDLVDGYQQGVDRLGQGLAYVNRGNVGQSFAWLSDHFTFVGVLMKQQELGKRLERLAALQGVGVHDIYASMGENGYWSGGYFVPERTFCAVPAEDQPASNLFSRHVVKNAGDEIQAHMSMFQTDKNEDYQSMVDKAGKLVVTWFNDDSKIVDDPKITQPEPVGSPEDKIKATDEGVELEGQEEAIGEKTEAEGSAEDNELPDESPLDIAAAASLVPLPEDGQEVPGEEELKDKQSYMKYLMGIAQNAGTGVSQAGSSVKGYIPTKLPTISTPSMPSMPSMSMPKVSLFSKKEKPAVPSEDATAQAAGKQAQPQEQETESQAEGDEAVVVEKPVVAAAESTEKKEEEEEEKNVVAAKPESDTQGK